MRAIKEIRNIMKKYNCCLIRSKKHLIWKHPTGQRITTPSSPSCKRIIRKIEAFLVNLEREK